MSWIRDQSHFANCRPKRRYATLALAEADCARLQALGIFDCWMNAYQCAACGAYHNGHMRKKTIRALKRAARHAQP